MSVRVTDKTSVALYDSTSGIAFGPVFESESDAEEFLAWLHENHEVDARECHPTHLATLVNEWIALKGDQPDF